MIKAYKTRYFYRDERGEALVHTHTQLMDESKFCEEKIVETFDTFDDAWDWFKQNTIWFAEQFGKKKWIEIDMEKLEPKNFRTPSYIVIYRKEVAITMKELMDMDSDLAIQYIKERWNA